MTGIESLGLSVRIYNCLKRVKIDTVEQLARMSDADLLRLRGFGIGCLVELRKKVAQPSPTRADRIRVMTDEELAAYWVKWGDNICQRKSQCFEALNADELIPDEWCLACALNWLQQPAEVAP